MSRDILAHYMCQYIIKSKVMQFWIEFFIVRFIHLIYICHFNKEGNIKNKYKNKCFKVKVRCDFSFFFLGL